MSASQANCNVKLRSFLEEGSREQAKDQSNKGPNKGPDHFASWFTAFNKRSRQSDRPPGRAHFTCGPRQMGPRQMGPRQMGPRQMDRPLGCFHDHPQDPCPAPLPVGIDHHRPLHEVDLHFFPGLRFHPPHALRRARLEPAYEALDRLVRTLKSVNRPQVRPDPLRGESIDCHRFNDPGMQGTRTPGPGGHFAGFSGALCGGCRCVAGHRAAIDVQFTGDPPQGKPLRGKSLNGLLIGHFQDAGHAPILPIQTGPGGGVSRSGSGVL